MVIFIVRELLETGGPAVKGNSDSRRNTASPDLKGSTDDFDVKGGRVFGD